MENAPIIYRVSYWEGLSDGTYIDFWSFEKAEDYFNDITSSDEVSAKLLELEPSSNGRWKFKRTLKYYSQAS